MATKKEEKSLTIVERIVKALNLGDEGKIGKFFNQQVKDANTAIKKLEANRKSSVLEHEIELDTLKGQIEDAKESVEAAYENVTPEDVSNNERMKNFASTYWSRVQNAEFALSEIEDELEDAKEYHKDNLEHIDGQIAKYKARIAKIKS